MSASAPVFDRDFRDRLEDLLIWRRDVRAFRTDPLPDGLLDELLRLAALAPSVGNSQPWRFVIVRDPDRRRAVRDSFEACNQAALQSYEGAQAQQYARLKLSGLDNAPEHLAVFAEIDPEEGAGLGRQTMPETLAYSVVGAVQTLFLTARAYGVGIGWVSILEPETVSEALETPKSWKLVAYLCIGYPQEEHDQPELVRKGWQCRLPMDRIVFRR